LNILVALYLTHYVTACSSSKIKQASFYLMTGMNICLPLNKPTKYSKMQICFVWFYYLTLQTKTRCWAYSNLVGFSFSLFFFYFLALKETQSPAVFLNCKICVYNSELAEVNWIYLVLFRCIVMHNWQGHQSLVRADNKFSVGTISNFWSCNTIVNLYFAHSQK
jgi:hypothetical protein